MNLASWCLLIAFVVSGQASTQQKHDGALTIRADGKERVFSLADLAKLPTHELQVTAESSNTPVTVSGVLLWDLLQAAGVPAAEASGRQRGVMLLKLTGADGQNAVLALVEVDPGFSSRPVLVANRRNGQPLDTVEGPWRVFIPSDIRHARWIRGLVSIEVTSVK